MFARDPNLEILSPIIYLWTGYKIFSFFSQNRETGEKCCIIFLLEITLRENILEINIESQNVNSGCVMTDMSVSQHQTIHHRFCTHPTVLTVPG